MLRKAAALLFVCACVVGWAGCGSTTSHFVYVAVPSANEVVAYREDPNSGVLTVLPGSPFAAGTGTEALALHPSNKFLYAANSGSSDISLFTIDAKGALTEVTPRTSLLPLSSVPTLAAIDSAGAYLYVANAGSKDISVFSIDSSKGTLTAVPQSGGQIGTIPISMRLSSSGNFLYVGGGPGSLGFIEVFSISAGQLTFAGSVSTDGVSPYGMVIDPTGAFLYASNLGSNSIAEFTIAGDGSLTPLSGSPIGGSLTSPLGMLIDPSGKFLYVTNNGSSTIAAYTIDSGGGLTVLTNSPFNVGTNPNVLLMDPSGKYLLAGTQGTGGGIHVFTLSSTDGTLSSLATYGTGNTPTSVVVKP